MDSDLVLAVGFVSTGLTGSSLGRAAGGGVGLGWTISFLASGFGSLAFSTLGGGGGGFLISGGASTFWIGFGLLLARHIDKTDGQEILTDAN